MMRTTRALLLSALLAGLAIALPAQAAEVPFLSGRVVDNAEILRPATREAITETLKAHEQKTTNQIAVLTISTIGDESIEEFATKVFESWRGSARRAGTTACSWSWRRTTARCASR